MTTQVTAQESRNQNCGHFYISMVEPSEVSMGLDAIMLMLKISKLVSALK